MSGYSSAATNVFVFAVKTAGAWSAQSNVEEICAAAIRAGAFAFVDGRTDAAFIATLPPGANAVQVSGANSSTGAALVEVYDQP